MIALVKTGALALVAAITASAASAQDVPSVLDGGDPTLVRSSDRWWLYPTAGNRSLSGWWSTDLKTWTAGGPMIREQDISWIDDDGAPRHSLWAPDMVLANGRGHFFYSVGPQNPTPSRLGVASCAGPAGPCTDSGKPLLTGGNGFEAIDPMVFQDPKSKIAYLYAGGSAGSKLRVFELAPDLLSIAREVAVEQPPHFTEGAFMHVRKGVYYLSYSHGKWNAASYQVHYATAPSPIGPWRYRGIILRSDAKYKGPGHHSFAWDDRAKSWLIAYHRWEGMKDDGPYKGHRRVAIQKISYLPDGGIAPIAISR